MGVEEGVLLNQKTFINEFKEKLKEVDRIVFVLFPSVIEKY